MCGGVEAAPAPSPLLPMNLHPEWGDYSSHLFFPTSLAQLQRWNTTNWVKVLSKYVGQLEILGLLPTQTLLVLWNSFSFPICRKGCKEGQCSMNGFSQPISSFPPSSEKGIDESSKSRPSITSAQFIYISKSKLDIEYCCDEIRSKT